jgi:K+-transporting ATPase ATPase F chain
VALGYFYTFFTPAPAIFAKSLRRTSYHPGNNSSTRRWIVTTGVIAGIVLVFLLLAYLVYALINAEAF